MIRFAFQGGHLGELKENVHGTHAVEGKEMSEDSRTETRAGRLKTGCLQWGVE